MPVPLPPVGWVPSSSATANAGVATKATSIDATTAKTYDQASGSKNAADAPPMKNTGTVASKMMMVANSIGRRTSITAAMIKPTVVLGLSASRASRKRRRMLPTS